MVGVMSLENAARPAAAPSVQMQFGRAGGGMAAACRASDELASLSAEHDEIPTDFEERPVKRMKTIRFALLSSVALAQPAVAQWTYRGYGEYEALQFLTHPPSPVQVGENHAVKLRLEAHYPLAETLSFGVQPFLRKDFNDEDRDEARLDELWLGYTGTDWDLRVGYQLFSWGSLESVRRIDVLNPLDYQEDILEPPTMGIPALRLLRLWENSDLSFYYQPYYIPSLFPGQHSIYSVSDGLPVEQADSEFSPQYALRYFYSGSGFDLALSYFHGTERNPLFALDLSGTPRVTATTYRSDRVGLEATKVVGDLLLKAEIIYRWPHMDQLEDSLLVGLGTEYTYYTVWRQSDLTLFGEYLADTSGGNPGDFPQLQNDVFLGARWMLNDQSRQQLEAGLLFDVEDSDSYVWRATYSRDLTNNITLDARYTNSFGFFFDPTRDEDGDGAVSLALRFNF
jgi:hypothetical protein